MLQAALPVLGLVAWQILHATTGSEELSSPGAAFMSLMQSLDNPRFVASVVFSLKGLGLAFLLSTVAGTVMGVSLGLAPAWARALSPVLFSLYGIPKITLYPIFLLFFGLDLTSRVAFAAFHGVFPMLLIVMRGTLGIQPVYLKVARAYRLSWWQRFWKIVVPAIVPSLAVALRISFSLTFIGLVVAELFSSYAGLGHELMRSMSFFDTGQIFALIFLIILIAVVPTCVFRMWERRLKNPALEAVESGGR